MTLFLMFLDSYKYNCFCRESENDNFARIYNQKMSFLLAVFFTQGTDVVKRLNIPLWCLNPFFKRDGTFLPAGLPIRITITYMKSFFAKYATATTNVFRTTLGISSPTVVARPAIDFAISVANSNPKIIYMYNVLKEQSTG